ncbi:MAG: NADH-quinone oxidoreductase subunit N, partial [Armatimonadota bacterium]
GASGASGLIANPVFAVGVAFLLVGLGFKASLFPFHQYAPDVYEGAPLPVTAFLSTATKIAAFGVLVRLCHALTNANATVIPFVLTAIAIATLLAGNAYALRQTRLKRILAGSSIGHAGYLAAGLTALFEPSAQRFAVESILYYLAAYTVTNLGIFAVLAWLAERGGELSELRDLDGLAKRHPFAAAALTMLVLSIAGLPPSLGFLGKLSLFLAIVKSGNLVVAVAALLCSAIGTAVYFGILVRIYFRQPGSHVPQPVGGVPRLVAVIAAAIVLIWGCVPLPWFSASPNAPSVTASR